MFRKIVKKPVFWFITAFLLRLYFSFGVYHPDLGNHLDWGAKFWLLGPRLFYENLFWAVSWANQPPGTIYLFSLVSLVYRLLTALFWWLNVNFAIFPSNLIPWLEVNLYPALVKLPFIVADLGMAFFAGKVTVKLFNKKAAQAVVLIVLFNPVFWYVSAVWGQTDSLVNFLLVLSIYLFLSKRSAGGMAVFLATFYFKASLLILLPTFLLWYYFSPGKLIKKIGVIVGIVLVSAIVSIPFVRWMDPVSWLYHLYRDRIIGHQGNMLTANAFNLWALIYGIDFTRTDLSRIFGLSLKQWGILFFTTSYLSLILLWAKSRLRSIALIYALSLVAYSSFLFMTNMHERYLYPAVILLTIVCLTEKKLRLLYSLLCLVWFLNMYHLWYIPQIPWLISVYQPLTLKIFALINLVIYLYLIIKMKQSVNQGKIPDIR